MSKKAGTPGSLAEVVLFASTIGVCEKDAEYFWLKLEGTGWIIGKTPIKNWRATLDNWKRQGWLPSLRAAKEKQPSVAAVNRVVQEYRNRFVGLNQTARVERWNEVFKRELGCSYQDAVNILDNADVYKRETK